MPVRAPSSVSDLFATERGNIHEKKDAVGLGRSGARGLETRWPARNPVYPHGSSVPSEVPKMSKRLLSLLLFILALLPASVSWAEDAPAAAPAAVAAPADAAAPAAAAGPSLEE